MDEQNLNINFSNIYELQNIINSMVSKYTDINIIGLPPINLNVELSHNIDDNRSGVEKARSLVDTLLSKATDKEAKAALMGDFSAFNNALERAYILLKYEIDIEIEKKTKELDNIRNN